MSAAKWVDMIFISAGAKGPASEMMSLPIPIFFRQRAVEPMLPGYLGLWRTTVKLSRCVEIITLTTYDDLSSFVNPSSSAGPRMIRCPIMESR